MVPTGPTPPGVPVADPLAKAIRPTARMASDHQLSCGASGADVTGVCSTTNVDLVRSIGADRVIDHAQDDFTRDGKEYGASRHECGSIEGSRAVVPSSGRRCSIGSSEVPRPGRGRPLRVSTLNAGRSVL